MKSWIRSFGTAVLGAGLDPRKVVAALLSTPAFVRDLIAYLRFRDVAERLAFPLRVVPTLSDRRSESGVARGHYFHQDLWAARRIHLAAPERHVDVGSRVDGFVAHLLTFREVEVVDIRPLSSSVRGLRFIQADMIMAPPPGLFADSVSCLHALEHFGLGRYGDPVFVDGWRRGLANIAAMVARGGTLLLSVPVGRQRIEFDAQRVFAPRTIVDEVSGHGLVLEEFCYYVDDAGDFFEGRSVDEAATLDFGCGCFRFRRGLAAAPREGA